MSDACDVKIAFLEEYTQATGAYDGALATLHKRIGTVKGEEYGRLYEFVEQARQKSETARRVMERHVADHGC